MHKAKPWSRLAGSSGPSATGLSPSRRPRTASCSTGLRLRPACNRFLVGTVLSNGLDLPELIFALLVEAGELESWNDRYKSRVRLATIDDLLFVHSAFPTDTPDAVFFGPDTYRFVRLVRDSLGELTEPRPRRIVDIGCGSGVGGLCAAKLLGRGGDVVLADINRKALSYAAVNAAINDVDHVEIAHSDILDGIEGTIDVVLANPPYLVDEGERLYRHGGGKLGLSIALRIVEQGLARLDPGGRLILYTGTPIIAGADPFFESLHAAAATPCQPLRL